MTAIYEVIQRNSPHTRPKKLFVILNFHARITNRVLSCVTQWET